MSYKCPATDDAVSMIHNHMPVLNIHSATIQRLYPNVLKYWDT